MSITSITSFKSLTMAESCLLSQPSLFYSKTKSPFISHSTKSFKIQNPTYNSSRVSHSLSLSTGKRSTGRFPLVTFVAQTSDWAQQEEKEDGATWENEGEAKWGETESSDGDGEGAGFEEEASEELKIFVGNLPFDVDSEKLAGLFEQAGTVEVAEVIYNRDTERSRGFGFVTMSTAEEVERAVNKYSGYELDGRSLTVNIAAPRGAPRPERPPRAFDSGLRAYVGNLPWDVDNVQLEQLFSEHGKVESARVVYDRETGRSRGFGFVTMKDEAELNEAIAALDGQSVNGRAIRVNVAEERPRRGF